MRSSSPQPGDVVVIAGKGHEHGQELAEETLPFDDREVVREALGSRRVIPIELDVVERLCPGTPLAHCW